MPIVSRIWAYHNTLLLIASFVVLFFVARTSAAQAFIEYVGSFGYISAVVVGFFLISTFTVVPAFVLLSHLAQELNPVTLALVGGIGSVIGDLVLFRFLKNRVFDELAPFAKKFENSPLALVFKTPYFAWFTPVLGAFIIASPFPDELGISLLGLSKMNTIQFVALTYVLDVAGILAIVLLAQA